MGQISIYLDDETVQKMRTAAKASGLSQSRWLAQLVHQELADTWPPSVAKLAGAWPDLPVAEDLRREMGKDVPREPF